MRSCTACARATHQCNDAQPQRTGFIPEEHGLVFQVQDVAHLQEDCSKCKDIDLQHVRDVNEHEGLLFLPAEDVQTCACYLHKHVQPASTADALLQLVLI